MKMSSIDVIFKIVIDDDQKINKYHLKTINCLTDSVIKIRIAKLHRCYY